MDEPSMNETVIREEKVMHLKTKMVAYPGRLSLTPTHLRLESHKVGVKGMGLIVNLLNKRLVEKKDLGFLWRLDQIATIAQGKHGRQDSVLEVTNTHGETFRILVSDYHEWETELNQYR